MTIPCKECLKYPVCRHKTQINCTVMFNYAHFHWEYERTFMRKLKKIFPNVVYLHLDNGKIPYYSTAYTGVGSS